MSGNDRPRSEQIRALIEEAERVIKEAERLTSHLDRSMRSPFWPERRQTPRFPSGDDRREGDDAA